jgi:hypothetical protein
MEVHHAKQSCYFEPVYSDSAICIGHRCIVGDISLGLQMPHVVGTLTSGAEVSKTMTYVWRGEQEVTIGWAFRLLQARCSKVAVFRAEREVPRVLNFFWPMIDQVLVRQDRTLLRRAGLSKFSYFCRKSPRMTKYMPDGLKSQALRWERACLAHVSESSPFTGTLFPNPGTARTPRSSQHAGLAFHARDG